MCVNVFVPPPPLIYHTIWQCLNCVCQLTCIYFGASFCVSMSKLAKTLSKIHTGVGRGGKKHINWCKLIWQSTSLFYFICFFLLFMGLLRIWSELLAMCCVNLLSVHLCTCQIPFKCLSHVSNGHHVYIWGCDSGHLRFVTCEFVDQQQQTLNFLINKKFFSQIREHMMT